MSVLRLTGLGALTLLLALVSVQWGHNLTLNEQWQLVLGHQAAQSFAQVNFIYAQLPRAVMAIVVGAVLGLVGSLMQQLTQNRLTSPLTLGTSSGAWLGLIIVNIWFSDWVADYSALAAMAGALLAACFISTSACRLGGWHFDVVGRLVGASLVIPRANCRRHASGNHWWQLFPAAVTQSACTLNPQLRGARLSTHLANVGRNVIDQLPCGRFTLLSEGEKNQVGQHVLRGTRSNRGTAVLRFIGNRIQCQIGQLT